MNAQPTSNPALPPTGKPAPSAAAFGWAANTEMATRFLPRHEDHQDGTKPLDPNIGMAVGGNTWEYFVSCAPSDALAQQFDVRTPVFMALHSMGEASSKRFLLEVAHQLKVPVQRLVIRRQGFGTELAVLYFADLAITNGQLLRVYSTDVKADDANSRSLTKLLLARAEMVALLVGEMPRQSMESSLAVLGEDAREGRSSNCTVVVLPLIASTTLQHAANRFAQQPGLQVRRSPRVGRALEAWPFLVSTWIHAPREPRCDVGAKEMMLVDMPTAPAASAPVEGLQVTQTAPPDLADAGASAPTHADDTTELQRHLRLYAQGVAGVKGVLSSCVFNARTLSLHGHFGASAPAVGLMVRQGRMLIATMQASSQALGMGKVVKEGVIALDGHQLMLRLVPGVPNMVLMVLFQTVGDAELAQFRDEVNRLQAAFKAALAVA